MLAFLKNPAVIHDAALYLVAFLTLLAADLGNVGPGAGWGAILAAVPVAASAAIRELLVVHQTNQAVAAQQAQQAAAVEKPGS